MIDAIYAIARAVGYTHPLHPAATHLTVGMTLAALIFAAVSLVTSDRKLENTYRHCLVLALLAWVPTVALGILDWLHFYHGAAMTAIRIKMGLAALLPVLLVLALTRSRRSLGRQKPPLLILLLGALMVLGLGYFGGELVYGDRHAAVQADAPNNDVAMGRDIFSLRCAFCHHTDSTEARVGPGLKGLAGADALPTSGWPMTDANLVRQMRTPYKNMPDFKNMSDTDLAAVIAYLKTL